MYLFRITVLKKNRHVHRWLQTRHGERRPCCDLGSLRCTYILTTAGSQRARGFFRLSNCRQMGASWRHRILIWFANKPANHISWSHWLVGGLPTADPVRFVWMLGTTIPKTKKIWVSIAFVPEMITIRLGGLRVGVQHLAINIKTCFLTNENKLKID